MQCAEYRDLVAADVDGMLAVEEVPRVGAHLAGCPRCAHLRVAEQQSKNAVTARRLIQPTPAEVRRRLMARLEAESQRPHWVVAVGAWWARPVRLALAGATLLLAVAVGVSVLRPAPPQPVPAVLNQVVARYRALQAQAVALDFRTRQPAQLRAYYRRTGVFHFANTVVNFEPLGYRLVGGTVVELAKKKSTFSVYRGRHGLLLCHRIQAADMKFPPGGQVVDGDHFYTVAGVTICMHREGDVMCFLASAAPRAEFVAQLAGRI
ncbi:MAG: anti-sigma factor family protein [Candidatus Binatia bacterium]